MTEHAGSDAFKGKMVNIMLDNKCSEPWRTLYSWFPDLTQKHTLKVHRASHHTHPSTSTCSCIHLSLTNSHSVSFYLSYTSWEIKGVVNPTKCSQCSRTRNLCPSLSLNPSGQQGCGGGQVA